MRAFTVEWGHKVSVMYQQGKSDGIGSCISAIKSQLTRLEESRDWLITNKKHWDEAFPSHSYPNQEALARILSEINILRLTLGVLDIEYRKTIDELNHQIDMEYEEYRKDKIEKKLKVSPIDLDKLPF